mgnify:CR=1 FL=1
MQQPFKRFLILQLYLTIAVYVLGFLAFKFVFPGAFFTMFYFLPLIFYLLIALVHGALIRSARLPARKFPQRFLAVFGAKIFAMMIFILLYAYFNPEIAVPFLILYLVYTVFEITHLLKLLRRNRQESS